MRSEIESHLGNIQFNRTKTLASLDLTEKLGGVSTLMWRPGLGRAHSAWQFMHIAVTEELFATARLFGTAPALGAEIEKYRGGSTPEDLPVAIESIRSALRESRDHLVDALKSFRDSDLEWVPEPIRDRGWTLRTVLQVLSWHESHHQGQIHLTLNLWKGSHGVS
jgi:uncharacterized damage-inducible protein DinB